MMLRWSPPGIKAIEREEVVGEQQPELILVSQMNRDSHVPSQRRKIVCSCVCLFLGGAVGHPKHTHTQKSKLIIVVFCTKRELYDYAGTSLHDLGATTPHGATFVGKYHKGDQTVLNHLQDFATTAVPLSGLCHTFNGNGTKNRAVQNLPGVGFEMTLLANSAEQRGVGDILQAGDDVLQPHGLRVHVRGFFSYVYCIFLFKYKLCKKNWL